MSAPKVAIIGPGSLGIMYGHFFEKKLPAGNFYFVEDAAHKQKHSAQTFSLNSEACDFKFLTPEEVSEAPDLILIAVKFSGLKEAAEIAAKIAGPETVVISVLNGISSEEILEQTLPQGTVIDCIAQKMDALNRNGHVESGCFGELCLGIKPEEGHKKDALKKICKIFDDLQMPYCLEEDIKRRMWCKWMLNVGVNQVLMVENACFKDVQKPGPMRDRMIGAMREVLALSPFENVGMTEDDFKTYLGIIDGLYPEGMPSMRQDRLAKRKSEVPLFAGTVLAKAKKAGIAVPFNQKLWDDVAEIEAQY